MAFTFNVADLEFVLRQIKIAEAHSAGTPLTDVWVDAAGNIVDSGTPGAVLAISDPHMPLGLRTVDGSLNNIVPGRETWGATDQVMPRMLSESFRNEADGDVMPFGPGMEVTNTDYGVIGQPTDPASPTGNGGHSGNVADADPRIISNLISDMSTRNPAAVEVWFASELAVAAWEEANPGFVPVRPGEVTNPTTQREITDLDLALIPNLAPDDGISAPFNAWMTFFGQFFDHGLDLISKGNNGTIFIPLQPDDPLFSHGPDGILGNGDEVDPAMGFMALTRSTPFAGPDADGIMGLHETKNTTSPFVDQNQTYTSHASHQVFLREYAPDALGRPQATGYLLDGQAGGLATWADVKEQARVMLGIELTDGDVLNVPMLRTDAYGEFIRDPDTGYAQVIIGIGEDGIPNTIDDIVVSGTPTAPVNTFTATDGNLTGAIRVNHSFLEDIAHNANPSNGRGGIKTADTDTAIGLFEAGTYDNELLDRHFITGDGRGNENIGLTSVHHIFHSEHNRQVESQKASILASDDRAFINEWLIDDIPADEPLPATLNWDGERLFQSARFATEMQYQHLVFEEFGRKINPNIDPFVFNSVTDINPAIFAEFANTVYRFGHSMLTDSMVRIDANGTSEDVGLINAFLNPVLFNNDGGMTADQAAGAVVRGMTVTQGNAIDEFVVSSLRSNLLGLPLDLPAINIARGRDTGVPTLNEARAELFSASNSTWLKPYESWVDFAANMRNPISVVNFIAAYGEHPTLTTEPGAPRLTLQQSRDAAMLLVFGGDGAPADRLDFLTGSNGTWTAANSGLNNIDLWIGGLAERIIPFGGMLGATFSAVFEAQLEALQNGDRFYYLTRTQGQNMLNELEENAFAKMIMANTDLSDPGVDGIRGTSDDVILRHIGADVFAKYDFVLEVMIENQGHLDPIGNDPVLQAMGLPKVQRDDPMTAGPDTNYLRFTGGEHVVLGGTSGNDTLISSDGDDAIWGDAGDDRIESGFGVDLVLGGAGNDVITDMGDEGDFLKGEDGDDVMTTAGGLDVLMGGNGKDIISLGVDPSEVFGGAGDDFILGSSGADFLLGNEGNDWIEGGGGFDTTAGDNSELFFNSAIVGHDVMFAGSDEHDFDAESGDDIMVQGESVMRNEGMFGFDWAIFKGVAIDAYADMRIKIFTTEAQDILRNRFDKTEAVSGWDYNDTLIGDDRISAAADPDAIAVGANAAENIFQNDGLDQAGIDRIEGLSQIVSVASGAAFWEEGNILLGGGGSDILRGNAGDDILDGDRWLNVRISIQNDVGVEIGTVDSLKHIFSTTDSVPAAWEGRSLFELLIDRVITPSQMHIKREILTTNNDGDVDFAVFGDLRENYDITTTTDGVITVAHTRFGNNPDVVVNDGTDTLRNIEVIRFADVLRFVATGEEVPVAPFPTTGLPVIGDTTPTEGLVLTVDTSGIADANSIAAMAFQWQSSADGGTTWVDIAGATGSTFTPEDLPGTTPGAQGGLQLRAEVVVTDGLFTNQTLLSIATAPVGFNWNAVDDAGSTFNGNAGDDIANGGGGVDLLNGNAGNDQMFGAAGSDIIDGGAGADFILGNEDNDRLIGGLGNDNIRGSRGDDTIIATIDDGDDVYSGGVGTDTLDMSAIIANITADLGADLNASSIVSSAQTGTDTIDMIENIITGSGADVITGSNVANVIDGGAGSDIIDGGAGADFILGNEDNDRLIGGLGNDNIRGSRGDDTIVATIDDGDDVYSGGVGTDTLDMSVIMANITADLGADLNASSIVSSAQTGTDTIDMIENIITGSGADVITGSNVANVIDGGGGSDSIFGAAGSDIIDGGAGADFIRGNEGNDRLTGGLGNDIISGSRGDDTIIATIDDGDDVYFGGVGTDTLDMSAITANITADLGANPTSFVSSAQTGTDTIDTIENIVTGSGADMIIASDAVNVIDGGLGSDTFSFGTAAAANGDTLVSFQPGDRIDLSGMDANSDVAGQQTFTLVTGALTDLAQILVSSETRDDGNYTVVEGNVTGDTAADFRISIKGDHALAQTDFAF